MILAPQFIMAHAIFETKRHMCARERWIYHPPCGTNPTAWSALKQSPSGGVSVTGSNRTNVVASRKSQSGNCAASKKQYGDGEYRQFGPRRGRKRARQTQGDAGPESG